ncbi:uncharacterized protein PRCAT00000922001 [Priceomyces carsonii]|uniref:uncharacterized protein n=1 Tax=Priceomyces carsonii TaxID=28549 RepID=UPI002ED7883F|nr:unnamed protein product [Priceomyces carsonii]
MTFQVEANTDPEVVRIFIIRHGQTDHNVKKILQGHIDIDLNQTGWKQALLIGKAFLSLPVDSLVTSDLVRCQNTAKEIVQHHPNAAVKVTPNLREREMGKVQGMYLKDALEKYGENFRNLGELKLSLLARINEEWEALIESSRENNYKNVIVCTHGGVITAFVNYLYGVMGYKLKDGLKASDLKVPYNTSVTAIDVNKRTKKGTIQIFGDTGHLGKQLEVKDQLLR